MNHKITLVTALAAATLTISAQSNMAPEFINPSPGSSIVITKMSNNGKWMVSETAGEQDGNIRPGGGVLINIDNPTMKYTLSHSSGLAGVGDVTDDGSLVVGECQMKPAYWLTATGEWTTLPLPAGFTTGRLNAVTPDGKYAVGIVNNGNEWVFSPVLYDLTTKQAIDLPNMPNIDMTNQDQGQNSLVEISPDGRYLVGMISQSYVMPTALCTYVYDRQTSTHKFIGFDEPATATGKWKAKVDGLVFVDEPAMSPNGEWVTGLAYMLKNSTGGEFGEEYNAAYRYNVPNDVFEVYDGQFDHDVAAFSITNDGVVLAATPAQNPYSSMIVRHGNYYYNLDQILKQIYNIDFESKTGFAVTGKPVCVSDDGLTIAMIPSTSDTYILRLKESLSSCCENIDMLGDYTISPASGSVFSQLRSVTLNFGHQVQLAGNATRITVTDNAGTNVKALRATVDGSRVTISFQTVNMASGREYTITVPAGMFNLAGDTSIKSREIKFTYTGRSEGAVNVVSVYPADGHAFARLDMSTNPVIVTFDAQVATAENAKGYFYRDSEGTDELVCELNLACAGNQMMAYPTAGQYLFKDLGYKVVIPAGSITDISGAGPNEELVYNYVGAYVREVPVDDRYLFQEDCSSTDNFLFYEGDHRTPAEVPASWGFTADSHPWWVTRDEDSTDMALASHSMYIPAGQSDDWVSTPQLYISDDKCVLTFDSQSYLKDKQDYLKVYLLATDDIFSALSASTVERFRKEGTVIYNELQSPGAKEEELAGDWRHNVVSLAEFAGKNVYIAFVNENNDQSAVFIDNIEVIHDTKYVLSFENAERLVNKESVTIKGIIDITSEIETFSTLSLTLKDADGKTVDTISETGLNLKKGDSYKFSFAKDLPLKSGTENKFTIELKLDDEAANIMSSVKNLTFEPMQKVVLEEFTGQACPN
ncbi:MAG: Ig-like domain-containing protein, partial [Muribaculaceae bacterium]|nr:Ig-like domain-containing protein [Muribaculaceae bacterium]